MTKKLVLIDGFSILFRAFYGMPLSMTAPDGRHTGAVYGFLTILQKVLSDESPDYLAVAFDLPEPTFRHTMYDGYKANRDEAPDEFKEQVPMVKELLSAMQIPIVSAKGFEADDVMGTLARAAEKDGLSAIIVSGDRDLLQIASEGTTIVIPKTRGGKTEYERYTPADVETTYGVDPTAFIELKALMGDSSDNVPGLPGVGPKTAEKLLREYGTIAEAKAHTEELKPKKAMEGFRDHFDLLMLSKELVTIRTDAPVTFDPASFEEQFHYGEETIDLFRRFGFRSMIARYGSGQATKAPAKEDAFVAADAADNPFEEHDAESTTSQESTWTILSDAIAKKAFAQIDACEMIGLSVTGTADRWTAAAIATSGATYVFPEPMALAHRDTLCALLTSEKQIATVNAKELYKITGCDQADFFDVVIAAYVIDPLKSDWDYDGIASGYLQKTLPTRKELMQIIEKSPDDWEIDATWQKLATLEARIAFDAQPHLSARLAEENGTAVFSDIEMPLCKVLADMETEGIQTSRDALADYAASLAGRIDELTNAIYEEAGETFNLNSPKQLSQILFEKMQIPGGKKTKTGYSTAADVLEKLAPEHPIVAHILEYRTYAKLHSTYAEGLPSYIADDGRIHTTFHQTITATGRLSSADPNLQNIPMRMELGRKIRKCFYPKDGFVFVDADYSQIELRILAHMSGDEKLIAAYKESKDIHRSTAAEVFHVPFDEVTDLQRRNAKAVNFGIVYGISAFGLSEGLSIPREEASAYIKQYFATYPKIKSFLDAQVAKAKESGYAESLFGRRRPVPELREANFMRRSFGERVAMNAPIQGTAADIMKIAMIRVADRLAKEHLRAKLILQIHDELLIEAPADEADTAKQILIEEMRDAAHLAVPLEVDCHIGADWYEAK